MKFCEENLCPDVAITGHFCPLHSDVMNRKERNAPRHVNDKWYTRKEWRGVFGVRKYKLLRNPQCEIEGCKHRATQVHHLREWKDTADWFLFMGGIDMQFLQSLCASCHARISMQIMQYGNKENNNVPE